jgi:4-amino-4-deoxy-L-arabinose transferase-like glycosyltransferase
MSLVYLRTDLTYDEAVYLRLARTIAECGLPLRRAYEDFSRFRLFENSPPLILYVASLSQKVFPGDDVPARLVHLAAFVLPTYLMVWWVGRVAFGAWAAFASLVVLLTNGSFVRATTHVLLNIPLGLFACMGLLAFYHASRSPPRRLSSLVLMALTTALAVWTKYQAVCVAAAIVAYVMYTVATRGHVGLRPMVLPLSVMVVSGATAVIALIWFFWAFGGREGLATMLTLNAGRISAASMSMLEIARAVMGTARECERTLGAAVLLLGAFAVCVEQRHRGLLVLLAGYVAATIAFNLILFRLPGAGSSYLDSAVPALALLAGPAAVRIVELATTTPARALLASAAIVIQLADSPASPYQLPRPNGSRVAAAYIAAHSPRTAGVLADTVAIEFYSERPVRAVSFTFPRQLVLQSLDGTSGDDISYVVIEPGPAPKNLDAMQQQWNTLLGEHFELVSAGAPGLHVYRRRPR